MIAGIVYAKGISIIHFAMCIAWFYVLHPDPEYVNTLTNVEVSPSLRPMSLQWQNCASFVEEIQMTLYLFLGTHIWSAFSCISCELNEGATGMLLLSLKAAEIVSVWLIIMSNIYCITLLYRYFGYVNESELDCYEP